MGKRLWDLAKSRFEIATILLGHRYKVLEFPVRRHGHGEKKIALTQNTRHSAIPYPSSPPLVLSGLDMCTTLPRGGVVGPIGAWWLVVVDMSCGRGSLAFASLCRHPKFGGSASSAPGIARGAARPVSSARDPSPWFTEAPPTGSQLSRVPCSVMPLSL